MKRVGSSTIWRSLGVTAMLIILAWLAHGALAQGEPSATETGKLADVSASANVSSRISYQGMLEEHGTPVTGTRNITFDFFTNNTCFGVAVYNHTKDNVPIQNGLFSTDVDVAHSVFGGWGLWLRVTIGGTALGCQEVLPVPYALNLRPGAHIEGSPSAADGWVLRSTILGAYPLARAIFGSAATGTAIRGESDGGYGVSGYTKDGVAVYGYDGGTLDSRGYAGVFRSENGIALKATSVSNQHYNHAGIFEANVGFGIYATSAQNNAVRAIGGDAADLNGVMQPVGKVAVAGLSGAGRGVYGSSRSNVGVTGISSENTGVEGQTASSSSYGGRFLNTHSGSGGSPTALQAHRTMEAGYAIVGNKSGTTGVAIRGNNTGNTGSGVVGYSNNYNGVFGDTARVDQNYGLYTPDNLYSKNYHLAGAVMHVAQNGGDAPLDVGDVVVFAGVVFPENLGGAPLLQVARASEVNSTAVAGVVGSRFNEAVVAGLPAEGIAAGLEITPDGAVQPGEYLLLVVQGPTQVNVSTAGGPITPGELLSTGSQAGMAFKASRVTTDVGVMALPGTVFGKALEPLDAGEGMIYVFVTLQ